MSVSLVFILPMKTHENGKLGRSHCGRFQALWPILKNLEIFFTALTAPYSFWIWSDQLCFGKNLFRHCLLFQVWSFLNESYIYPTQNKPIGCFLVEMWYRYVIIWNTLVKRAATEGTCSGFWCSGWKLLVYFISLLCYLKEMCLFWNMPFWWMCFSTLGSINEYIW